MADKRDYYEVLGVDKSADDATLKKAYRQLAKKYHPDVNPGDKEAEAKFKEATEAYSVLSDPDKRRQYDQFGHAAFEAGADPGAGGFGGFQGGGNGSYQEFHFNGENMDDIFGDIFGNMFHGSHGESRGFGSNGTYEHFTGNGSGFHSGFGGSGFHSGNGFGGFHQQDFPQKGSDVKASINVTFDEAAFGADKRISLSGPDGSSGAPQTLQIHIPAGIDTGKSIHTDLILVCQTIIIHIFCHTADPVSTHLCLRTICIINIHPKIRTIRTSDQNQSVRSDSKMTVTDDL